jgi:hypothetical protein
VGTYDIKMTLGIGNSFPKYYTFTFAVKSVCESLTPSVSSIADINVGYGGVAYSYSFSICTVTEPSCNLYSKILNPDLSSIGADVISSYDYSSKTMIINSLLETSVG